MTTGQLRVRVRAYEREKTWAPDYVADQLAGTRQAADKHRTDAALWSAETTSPLEDLGSSRHHKNAEESAALAKTLDEQARQLAEADEVRAAWYAHTAETRAAAERAGAELAERRVDSAPEPPGVTAKEWLAAHDADLRAEDPHRPVTGEHELAETSDQRARDQRDAGPKELAPEAAATTLSDIREESAEDGDSRGRGSDTRADAVRIPTAEETAESVRRAQRALQELRQRQAADARRANDDARDDASHRQANPDQHLSEQELPIDAISR
jgi:hypothetical protein